MYREKVISGLERIITQIEDIRNSLDGFRVQNEMTSEAYFKLNIEISMLDDLLKEQERQVEKKTVEKRERKHVRWGRLKQKLVDDFRMWVSECKRTRSECPKDMIEFLYQKGFIKGKKWHRYIDSIAVPPGVFQYIRFEPEPLAEGKIPPDTLV